MIFISSQVHTYSISHRHQYLVCSQRKPQTGIKQRWWLVVTPSGHAGFHLISWYTEYVLAQAHALMDTHAPAAKIKSHHPKTLKFELYSGLLGRHFLVNKKFQRSTRFLFTVYMHTVARYWTTGFIVEINRCAPKPLHSRTALLLGHIR